MTIDEAIALVKIERECVIRANVCDRKCEKCDLLQDSTELIDMYKQIAEWLEELKEMRKNQGQVADFWYQEGISRELKLIFDKIEEIKNRYDVEDFAIIGILIKIQEIALEMAEQLKERTEK